MASTFTSRITYKEALELVDFWKDFRGNWRVSTVKGNCGRVEGNCGTVKGYCATVEGDCGIVKGKVLNTINGREWQYVETPRQRLQRLIEETGNQEILEAFNQLEDN